MKIGYRSNPVIKMLENRKLGDFAILADDLHALNRSATSMKSIFHLFSMNPFEIFYMSVPFMDAYTLSHNKLMDINLWKDIKSGFYCILRSSGSMTMIVYNDIAKKVIRCEVLSIEYDKEMPSPFLQCFALYTFSYCSEDIGKLKDEGYYIKHSEPSGYISSAINNKQMVSSVCSHFGILLFIQYAEIETKILSPGKKLKEFGCKYLNETKSKVTILNSTWYTNLVKSDAFKVRGHFRLQPIKKDGEWTKKLIWINEFEKTGYTAPARKTIYKGVCQ